MIIMPYIDKMHRGRLQDVVRSLLDIGEEDEHDDQFWCVVEIMQQWLKYYQFKGHNVDGFINYTFTILLKHKRRRLFKHQVKYIEAFIHSIFYDFYGKQRSYSNYQRGVGLLYCMLNEFKRRKWLTPKLSKWFNKTIRQYEGIIANYEDNKRLQNGDV